MTKFSAMIAMCVAVIALGGMLIFTILGTANDAYAACRSLRIAGAGQLGGSFEMQHHDGRTVTDADVITEPTLMYFGYTFCPDVCPLDTARNAAAIDLLSEAGHSVTPVFVTVDPERDTAAELSDFVSNLHEKMIGLTGTEEQVNATAKTFRVYFQKQEAKDEFYLVDHSAYSYLVKPGEGFVAAFDRALSEEQLVDQMTCYL